MAQKEAVAHYKQLSKKLLSVDDRKRLQEILGEFVRTKSFVRLSADLPGILNTDAKRQLGPALKTLIPPRYHAEFNQVLSQLRPGQLPDRAPAPLPGDASNEPVYQNWGVLENQQAFAAMDITDRDSKLYENCRDAAAAAEAQNAASVQVRPTSTYENTPGSPQQAASPTSGAPLGSIEREVIQPVYARGQDLKPAPAPQHPAHNVEELYATPDKSRTSSRAPSPSPVASPPKQAPPLPKKASTSTSTLTSTLIKGGALAWDPANYMAGEINRQEAERILMPRAEGKFLVRAKNDSGRCYVLSTVKGSKVVHLLLEKQSSSTPYCVNGESFGQCHEVQDLIELIRVLGQDFEYPIATPVFQ